MDTITDAKTIRYTRCALTVSYSIPILFGFSLIFIVQYWSTTVLGISMLVCNTAIIYTLYHPTLHVKLLGMFIHMLCYVLSLASIVLYFLDFLTGSIYFWGLVACTTMVAATVTWTHWEYYRKTKSIAIIERNTRQSYIYSTTIA